MNQDLVPRGSNPLTTYEAKPTGSMLDRIVESAQPRLDYLRGNEKVPGNFLKLLLYGSGALWAFFHLTEIRDFVFNIVDIETKLVYGAGLVFVLWLVWEALSSKKFQFTVAMMVDHGIQWVHRKWVARDPRGAAQFCIDRLKRVIRRGDESKAVVAQGYEQMDTAATEDQEAALKAYHDVQGFMTEQKSRAAGHPPNKRIQMTDNQLDNAIAIAKGELHRRYIGYQNHRKSAQEIRARYAMVSDFLDNSRAEVINMERDLESADRDYQLKLSQMRAMDAANEVNESQAKETYNTAVGMLRDNAELFAGRTQMLMDRLDASVQNYHVTKASGAIADEAFFTEIANDPQFQIKPETQQLLIEGSNTPVISEVEEFLGADRGDRAEGLTIPATSAAKPNRFKNLLGGGR